MSCSFDSLVVVAKLWLMQPGSDSFVAFLQAELEGCEAVWHCEGQPVGASRGDVHHQGSDPSCPVTIALWCSSQHKQATGLATLTHKDCAASDPLSVPEPVLTLSVVAFLDRLDLRYTFTRIH